MICYCSHHPASSGIRTKEASAYRCAQTGKCAPSMLHNGDSGPHAPQEVLQLADIVHGCVWPHNANCCHAQGAGRAKYCPHLSTVIDIGQTLKNAQTQLTCCLSPLMHHTLSTSLIANPETQQSEVCTRSFKTRLDCPELEVDAPLFVVTLRLQSNQVMHHNHWKTLVICVRNASDCEAR